MIQAHKLNKIYNGKMAVNDISFTIRPGIVTGFLGPNGAGKSTTMRMILGLDRPTNGWARVNGKALHAHDNPLQQVGALLDAKAVHPGLTAEDHLLALATTHGIARDRVKEMLTYVGLEAVARRRVGGFSLGMHQRLGVAAALLGDPQAVVLDEPINGLDPEGVLWIRQLLRQLAQEGRTVFLSSHLMSEMAQAADHLIVIGKGRVIADAPIQELLAGNGSTSQVRVRTRAPQLMADALAAVGATVRPAGIDGIDIEGLSVAEVARVAGQQDIPFDELKPLERTLEQVYLDLTEEESEYRSAKYKQERK
jgi:ABC-2 type transport system ATP-binding protein